MARIGNYYIVVNHLYETRVPNHLEYGYEFERDFRHALWQLLDLWRGRTGECVGDRNGFVQLRFHDTPGGRPDEAWLPCCLVRPTDAPDKPGGEEADEADEEIARAFGFD